MSSPARSFDTCRPDRRCCLPSGSLAPSGAVSVTHGSEQSFTITSDPGYHVAEVLVDGVSVGAAGAYTFSDVTSSHTIDASFGLTVERRIGVGADDAEENATGKMSLTSSDLELVFDGSNQQVGLRFTNLALARGAVITRAYVQFEADAAQSESTNLVLQGQAADSAASFTTASSNLSSRPRTSAAVGWSPGAWTVVGEAGANQRSPDLSAVIQEIVDRPGWASGNALVILITGTGHRTARSHEGKALGAALLHVESSGGVAPAQPSRAVAVESRNPDFALGVGPVPARGALRVEFSLADGQPASLELLDVTGRRVAAREVGMLGPGRHGSSCETVCLQASTWCASRRAAERQWSRWCGSNSARWRRRNARGRQSLRSAASIP